MNTAQTIIAALTRTKVKPLTLDGGLVINIKSLSLSALEDMQERVKTLGEDANPRAQFQPVLQAAVEGLENVTLEEMGGFLIDDLKAISERAMEVGK